MKHFIFAPRALGAAAALVACLACAFLVQAQEARTPATGTPEKGQVQTESFQFPPADGMVGLTVSMPRQVRVSDTFTYAIDVKNLTKNIVLHDVTVEQRSGPEFQIESARVEQSGQQQQVQSQQDQQGRQGQQDQQDQQGRQQQQDEQQNPSAQEQPERGQQQEASQGGQPGRWVIGQLNPGETRSIRVSAASDAEGRQPICLSVSSYRPAICIATEFVKVDLQLTKQAPERAQVCEVIELAYTVRNSGSADLGAFVIHDPLPEGLQTIEGNKELRFTVDGLKAGDSRKFVARVVAQKAGRFESRAVALEGEKPLSRSAQTATEVQAPQLAVAIDGPDTGYIQRRMTYTVRVSNTGEMPARDARLWLRFPQSVRLASLGQPQASDHRVEAPPSENRGEPTPAEPTQVRENQGEQGQDSRNPQADQERQTAQADPQASQPQGGKPSPSDRQRADTEAIRLGEIAPGKTVALRFTASAANPGSIQYEAVAAYPCQVAESREAAWVEAVAQTQTEIIAVPALFITVIDQEDPVQVEGEATYRIAIGNEGDAPDHQVQVTVEIPEQLEYVSATGTTEAKAEGRTVSFAPIETLQPGQKAEWLLRAKVKQEGEIALRATLKSQQLRQAAISEEPTTILR